MKELETVQRVCTAEKVHHCEVQMTESTATIPGHKDIDDVLNQFVAFEREQHTMK